GRAEAAGQVGRGDEVALQAVQAPHEAIPGDAVAGELRLIAFGFALTGAPCDTSLVEARDAQPGMAHLVGRIGDQSTDGAGTRNGQSLGATELRDEAVELFFAEVRMNQAEAANLLHHRGRPLSLTQP